MDKNINYFILLSFDIIWTPIQLLNTNFYDAMLMKQAENNRKITDLKIDDDILGRVDDYLRGYTTNQKQSMDKKLQKLEKNKNQQIHIEDARVRNSFSLKQKSFTRDYDPKRNKRSFKSSTTTTHSSSKKYTTANEEGESSSEEVVFI